MSYLFSFFLQLHFYYFKLFQLLSTVIHIYSLYLYVLKLKLFFRIKNVKCIPCFMEWLSMFMLLLILRPIDVIYKSKFALSINLWAFLHQNWDDLYWKFLNHIHFHKKKNVKYFLKKSFHFKHSLKTCHSRRLKSISFK